MKTTMTAIFTNGKKVHTYTKTINGEVAKEEQRKIKIGWANRDENKNYDLTCFEVKTTEE